MKDRYVAAIAIAILSMGLLIFHDQPVLTSNEQPATLLAARLASSVDPFLHRSGRPAVRIWKVIFCGRVNVGMRRMNRRFESNRHSDYR